MKVVISANQHRAQWSLIRSFRLKKALFIVVVPLMLLTALPVSGGAIRTQTFELEEGWNAIYLSVEPLTPFPSAVFTNSPVDIVAAYDGVFSPRQFSSEPSANMLNQLGWGVWYSPARPDAFLSDLAVIHGQKPYLLHAKAAGTLNIEGKVEVPKIHWQPNAYNLVGFCLDELAPPTFSQFFTGSDAHTDCRVYRLVNGTWRKVLEPETEAMRSGEAFWIHCNGNSNYQGPLKVETALHCISLGMTGEDIVIRNETLHPLESQLLHVVGNGNGLPLAIVIEMINEEVGIEPLKAPMTSDAWEIVLPQLEAGDAIRIPLALHMEAMIQPEGYALLCVKTDLGTQTWLPVRGRREEQQ